MRILFVTSGIPTVHEALDWYVIRSLVEVAEQQQWELQVYHLNVRRALAKTALETAVSRMGIKATLTDEQELASEGILQKAFSFRPDISLFMHGGYTSAAVLRILRDYGFRTAVWIVDDPYEIDGSLEYARDYDVVFSVDRGAVEKYRSLGMTAHTLPLGTSEKIWRHRAEVGSFRSDLFFAGSAFPSRLTLFQDIQERMRPYRFLLMGQWWDRLPEGHPYDVVFNGLIPPQDVARFVSGSRLPVNIHRGINDPSFFDGNVAKVPALSPNNRTFDIASAGKVQLVDYREDIYDYFDSDEVLTFRDEYEFVDLVDYYLRPDQEDQLRLMGEKARRRVLASHTMRHRITQLLAIVEGRGGGL